jgi:hypothetical protein
MMRAMIIVVLLAVCLFVLAMLLPSRANQEQD